MTRVPQGALAGLLAAARCRAGRFAHPERHAYFPDGSTGRRPHLPDAGRPAPGRLQARLRQADPPGRSPASDGAAGSGSWEVPLRHIQPERSTPRATRRASRSSRASTASGRVAARRSRTRAAAKDYDEIGGGILATGAHEKQGAPVANYEYQRKCPNAQNLIAIIGDDRRRRPRCDVKCNIQIEGTGAARSDVLISGQRSKLNVIRADRADGIYLRNFTVEFSDFNNIYVARDQRLRDRRHRVALLAASTASCRSRPTTGSTTTCEAFGSGDSGIYPGSGPEGHCQRYGIEIRNSNSHHNTIGYSGTAGNGVWAHDNKFHNNATGMTTDSFASGHPGMPQDCAKWENNEIYSNNQDLFNDEHDAYCKQPDRRSATPRSCARRSRTRSAPASGSPAATATSSATTGSTTTGATASSCSGCRRRSRRARRQGSRHLVRQHVHRQHDGRAARRHARPQRPRLLVGRAGRGNCWSGNTGPGGRAVLERRPACRRRRSRPRSAGLPARAPARRT